MNDPYWERMIAPVMKDESMNAVVSRPDQPAEGGALLEIISRAASDPTVDVEKMERLMAMHERITARQAEAAFNAAMEACQAEMHPISTDATNPQTRSKYATYGKLDRALRPIYTRHGFSLSFSDGETTKPDHVRVLCVVRHKAGYRETHWKDMPADGKGAKGGDVMTKTHAAGAAQQYGMRYLLKGIFNVAIGEDDRDGNGPEPTLSKEQVANVEALMTEVGADKAKFLKWAKVNSLEEILACNYQAVIRALEDKRKR
jgi:hypothetical protein